MMRKHCAILLTAVLLLSTCFAFPSHAASDPLADSTEAVAEAARTAVENSSERQWTVAESDAADLPEEIEKAFNKATENLEGDVIPLAYFAAQLTTGTNYQVLCRVRTKPSDAAPGAETRPSDTVPGAETRPSDAVPETEPVNKLMVAVINEDIEGSVRLAGMSDFRITDFTDGTGAAAGDNEDGAEAPESGTDGTPAGGQDDPLLKSWAIPEDFTECVLPEDVGETFDKALENFLGNELVPMALLGTRQEEGMSYALLCHSILTTADSVESIQVVTLYKDLEGNSYITNVTNVEPEKFTEFTQPSDETKSADKQ